MTEPIIISQSEANGTLIVENSTATNIDLEIARLRQIINKEAQVCTCFLSVDTCRHCKLEEKLQKLGAKLPEKKS